MKAVIFTEHGGPEVLRYTEVPDPKIGPDDVLVRVRACALNYLDIWERRGLPGITFPMPHISGSDIAGEISQVGAHVTRVKVGQRVLLAPGISCGHCAACSAGLDNRCRKYTLFGYMVDGGYAELVKAPEINVIPIPGDLTFEEAAAVPLVFLTAWHMLLARAELMPGEDVLVIGAGSGVGSAAIQIAKVSGARVIATAGSDAKLAKARDLGADAVINHTTQNVADEVKRFTEKRGVDVVVEHVGAATWKSSVASLAVGGRLVACGATTGYAVEIDLRHLFAKQISLLGSYMGGRGELHAVLKLIGERKLKAVIDRVLPLAQAAEAQEWMEKREQFGKIILRP
jgi:NADPH:quinone reductase-like Zn-dependent oxidoreductase